MKYNVIFSAIVLLGLTIMATYTFFGVVTLVGLIMLVESIPPLRWLFERTANVIDILLFLLTIGATLSLGVTIAGSLTIAGLGFTLVYKPYLRNRYVSGKTIKPKRDHYRL